MTELLIYNGYSQLIVKTSLETIDLLDTVDLSSVIVLGPTKYNIMKNSSPIKRGADVTVKSKGTEYVGVIDSVSSNAVTIKNEYGTFVIREYDEINTADFESGPTIVVEKESQQKTIASYLFSGVSWSPLYKVFVTDDTISWLTCDGEIINTTGHILSVNDLSLMSGSPVGPGPGTGSTQMMARREQTAVSEQILDEYVKYTIGAKSVYEYQSVNLFTAYSTEGTKKYYHDLQSGNSVEFGYEFSIDQYLPGGKAQFYSSSNGIGNYVGSSYINESREGDNINVRIGKSTKFKIQTVEEINVNSDEGRKVTHTFTSSINTDASITCSFYVGTIKVLFATPEPDRRESGKLEWDVTGTQQKIFTVQLLE